jgi:Fe-S cluster assembly protein SufD
MTLPFADQLAAIPESDTARRAAAVRYTELGLPTPRDEKWKYTNLSFLESRELNGPAGVASAVTPILETSHRLVFTNGVLDTAMSSIDLPKTVRLISAVPSNDSRAWAIDDTAVSALNTALSSGAVELMIEENADIERPIEILFSADGKQSNHVNLRVTLNEGASATLVERHIYRDSPTSTLVTGIDLCPASRLRHYRMHEGDADAVSLVDTRISMGANASYEAFSLITGGRLSRHEVTVELNGPGAEVHLNGAHVLSGQSHADTTTEIRHMAPHCASRETYRHVMDGSARSVFQGKIYVAEGAQKTDGFQLNQSLMLSATAEVNAKPELEIYADDVKCSHGATSGRLDEEALFYLRSRGIPETDARAMLVEAFIGASIDLITDQTVREAFRARAARSLATREQGE